MDKLKKLESRKVCGNIRKTNIRKRNIDNEDIKLWSIVNKLNTQQLSVSNVYLIKNDNSSIEIINPFIKRINKSFTSIIYENNDTTIKFNNEDVLNLVPDSNEEIISELKSKDLKNKKLLSKVKLIPVDNIDKILIKSIYMDMIIYKPQVYKLEKKLLYVIYGDIKVKNVVLNKE